MRVDGLIRYPDLPVYYCADLHLGHRNILLYCGRKQFMVSTDLQAYEDWVGHGHDRDQRPKMSDQSLKNMTCGILDEINTTVPADAVLAIVGDFCFGPKDNSQFWKIARGFRLAIKCCHIHLVWGNHDRRNTSDLFQWTSEKAYVQAERQMVCLNHEAQYFWVHRHKGVRHYYGHSHSFGEEELDRVMPGRFSMDVGIDNIYRLTGRYAPIPHVETEKIMRQRTGFTQYHHQQDLHE